MELKEEILNKIKSIEKKKRKPSMTVRFTPEEKAYFEYLSFATGKNQSELMSEAFKKYFEQNKNFLSK